MPRSALLSSTSIPAYLLVPQTVQVVLGDVVLGIKTGGWHSVEIVRRPDGSCATLVDGKWLV